MVGYTTVIEHPSTIYWFHVCFFSFFVLTGMALSAFLFKNYSELKRNGRSDRFGFAAVMLFGVGAITSPFFYIEYDIEKNIENQNWVVVFGKIDRCECESGKCGRLKIVLEGASYLIESGFKKISCAAVPMYKPVQMAYVRAKNSSNVVARIDVPLQSSK